MKVALKDKADELRRLLGSGTTLEDAARQLGSSRSHVHRTAIRLRMQRREKPRRDDECKREIRRLRKQGKSISRTAVLCGVNRCTVRRYAGPNDRGRDHLDGYRCPECGCKSLEPTCIACEVRKAI